jgi:hypothetical protein
VCSTAVPGYSAAVLRARKVLKSHSWRMHSAPGPSRRFRTAVSTCCRRFKNEECFKIEPLFSRSMLQAHQSDSAADMRGCFPSACARLARAKTAGWLRGSPGVGFGSWVGAGWLGLPSFSFPLLPPHSRAGVQVGGAGREQGCVGAVLQATEVGGR